jgi:hypothetical protein
VLEKTFLVLGMLMFFAAGALVFAAIDQVPYGLIDNAIILGCLSFFVAFLMLIDLSDPLARWRSHLTQTENGMVQPVVKLSDPLEPTVRSDAISTVDAAHPQRQVQVDVIETGVLPRAETPILSRIQPCPESAYTKHNRQPVSMSSDPRNSQDFCRAMQANVQTYVRAPTVDQDSSKWTLRKPVERKISQKRYKAFHTDDEVADSPIRPGYVANVAKMWDNKMRKSKGPPDLGQNTSV